MSGDDKVCAALACGRRAMFKLAHRTLTTGPRETCGQHIAAGIREIGASVVGDTSTAITVHVTPLEGKKVMDSAEKPLHIQRAEGLRRIADMFEAQPEVSAMFWTVAFATHVFEDKVAALGKFARIAARYCDGNVSKNYHDEYAKVTARFDGVTLGVQTDRELVCERVVTGTETVTKSVPDPVALAAVPTVEVTEVVETTEWQCKPLLAAESKPSVVNAP